MKCLETRQRNGMRWRRYLIADGVIRKTYEVPETVIRYLGPKKLQEALERAKRDEERRLRDARIKKLLQAGWKTTALAHEFGLSDSMVRRIAQRMRAE